MPTWDDVLEIAAGIPEVEVSTWFRTPALRIAKKGFVRLRKEDGGVVVLCDLDEKAALLASGDPAYYTTPHYDDFGAILVNLERIDLRALTLLVTRAWALKAPARLRTRFPEFDRTEPGTDPGPPSERVRRKKPDAAKPGRRKATPRRTPARASGPDQDP